MTVQKILLKKYQGGVCDLACHDKVIKLAASRKLRGRLLANSTDNFHLIQHDHNIKIELNKTELNAETE